MRGRQPASSISSTIHTVPVSCREYQSLDGRDVAIANAFQGYLDAGRELRKEVADGTPRVVHPLIANAVAMRIEDRKEREMLASPGGLARVGVAADLIMRHAAPPWDAGSDWVADRCTGSCSAFIGS
jgi:hypothetical protein